MPPKNLKECRDCGWKWKPKPGESRDEDRCFRHRSSELGTHTCRVCERQSMSRKGKPYGLCGPHLFRLPKDWWDGFDAWVRNLVGLSKE